MKKLILLFIAAFGALASSAQTVLFHETFDPADSITSTGNSPWFSNSTYQVSGTSCYRDTVNQNDSSYLVTNAFSTVGSTFVLLEFDHICKIEFFDIAQVEVSDDNGLTWNLVTSPQYLGASTYFASFGNRFSAGSYGPLWSPGANTVLPNNTTWWQPETFDISSFAGNAAQVKVRFKVKDGNGNGNLGNYGWLIDNIEVTGAPSELIPPTINYINPIYLGNIYSTGPFNITVDVIDNSGASSATCFYTINGGPQQSVAMTNTTGTTWVGTIPTVSPNDVICYYVTAVDGSPALNTATAPTTGCRQFTALAGITFPYFDDFEGTTLFATTPGNSGADWELGTPNYGLTTGAYSGINAWDINLNAAPSSNANAILYSPVFDFSLAVNARLSFWQNFNTSQWDEGVHLEYTTDGTTWNTLGSVSDPNNISNWYNTYFWQANSDVWNNVSNGWIQSEYKLTQLNNIAGPVQFRFIYTSTPWSSGLDGHSIDDFLIRLPAPQDASVDAITSPSVNSCIASGLSNTLTVDLLNDGSQNITGPMNVTYIIDNGTPVTESFTGTITPNTTGSFTFTAPFTLTPGTHTIKVYTSLTNDGFAQNDTLTVSVLAIGAVSVPYLNGFETTAEYDDFCPTNTQQGRVQLSTNAANTGNQGVVFDASNGNDWDWGPDTVATSGNYIWSTTTSDQQFSALRLIANTTGFSNLKLEFDAKLLRGWQDDLTNFRVVVNGTMITPHFQPINATTPYITYQYDLSSFLPASTLTIDFEAKVYDNLQFSGTGIYLDNVFLYEPQAQDAKIGVIVNPNLNSCIATGNSTLSVSFSNNGLQNIVGPMDISYVVDNGTPVTEQYNGTLTPTSSTTYTFTTPMNIATPGTHTITVYTSLVSDGITINDTLVEVVNAIVAVPVPYSNGFEQTTSFNDFCITTGSEGQVQLSTVAANTGAQGALFDALSSTGWTFGTDTIPNSTSSAYIWDPGTSANQNVVMRLQANTSGYNSLVLEFDASLQAPSWGSEYTNFRVMVNGTMVTPHLRTNGQPLPYTSYRYDLTPFLPANSLAIDFQSKVAYDFPGNNTGVFLDNVYIYEPDSIDIRMLAIVQPGAQSGAGLPTTVEVSFRNIGFTALNSIPLAYRVDNNPPVVGTWAGTLAPNAVANYTFTTTFTSPTGAYNLCAWSQVSGDLNQTNDTVCEGVVGVPVLGLPFVDDFEGTSFFAAVNTQTNGWELGTPDPPAITGAHSGINAWEIDLDGPYPANCHEELYSPYFDFAQATNFRLEFWHWYNCTFQSDGGYIEYTADGGTTWLPLGAINDPSATNWYITTVFTSTTSQDAWGGPFASWFPASYDLSFLDNNPQPVRFRFVFVSQSFVNGLDGWAVDDFSIVNPTGVSETPLDGMDLFVYPNPANDQTTVAYELPEHGEFVLTLRDMMGKEITRYSGSEQAGKHLWTIDVSQLPAGIYFCELGFGENRMVSRIVVSH